MNGSSGPQPQIGQVILFVYTAPHKDALTDLDRVAADIQLEKEKAEHERYYGIKIVLQDDWTQDDEGEWRRHGKCVGFTR